MTLPRDLPAGWIWGVDTSVAQGPPTYVPALRDAGCSFLIARATQGLHDVDDQFTATVRACSAASLPIGAYGVLCAYPREQAEAQARHFLDAVRGVPLDLAPVLDFELSGPKVSAAGLLAAARAWCEVVEDELGRGVVVYTGPSFISGLRKLAGPAGAADLAALATRPLFVAHYTQNHARLPSVPGPWEDWGLWQASGDRKTCRNAAQLPGGTADIDVDFFRGSVEELRALGRREVAPDVRQSAGG